MSTPVAATHSDDSDEKHSPAASNIFVDSIEEDDEEEEIEEEEEEGDVEEEEVEEEGEEEDEELREEDYDSAEREQLEEDDEVDKGEEEEEVDEKVVTDSPMETNFAQNSDARGILKFPGSSDKPLTKGEESSMNCEETKYLKSQKHLNNASDKGDKKISADREEKIFDKSENASTYEEEIKHMDKQLGDVKKRIASRSVTPDIWTANLPSGAEINDGNKRPAAICNFFEKGWCIRGSSCRFLHIKENVQSNILQPDGDEPAANLNKQVQLNEERNSSSGTLPDSQQLPSLKDDPGLVSSFEAGKCIQRQNWPADDHSMHALPIKRDDAIFKDNLLLYYGHPSSTTVPTTNHLSAWRGSSLSFSYSSLSSSSTGARKLPDIDGDYCVSTSSSLLQSSTPFSASQSNHLSRTNVSLHFAQYKSKITSDDWEPSVPFRPSFFISTILSSSGRQYDPLHDSIELPGIGNGPLNVSLCNQGTSALSPLPSRVYNNPMVPGTLGLECNDYTSSLSSHNKNAENKLDKAGHLRGKSSLTAELETLGSCSVVDEHNGTMHGNGNLLGPSEGKFIEETDNMDIDSDFKNQSDGSRHKKDFKAESVRRDSERDAKHKMDENVQSELRASRYFRGALIELVKELLKPKWREGHLSKDAHNMIVKKAVDKVVTTLEPQQIPTTMELVKQYLDSSRLKIAKLVEGYVDKYGKS